MPFNISEFQGEINKRGGFAKLSNFECYITGPPSIRMDAGYTSRDIEKSLIYRIQSVDMPQRSSTPIPMTVYGSPYQIGGMVNYIPATITVLVSPNMIERDYFLAWQDLVVGPHRRIDRGADIAQGYDLGYYDEYARDCTIEIRQYNESGRLTHATKLLQCYPTLIGGHTGSWDSDGVVTMQVTIAYKSFVDLYRQHILLPTVDQQIRDRLQRQREYQESIAKSQVNVQRQLTARQTTTSSFASFRGTRRIGGQEVYRLSGDQDAVSLGFVRSLMYKAARIRNF